MDRLCARYLNLAARAALRAAGDVEPNPLVGAVLVREGEILGIGHHRRFGGLHAEREALADCRGRGHEPRGATAYVTLEPCCHHGKQPPCTDALIEAGVAGVVYARPDPHETSGGGAGVLRAAGISCERSGASRLATRLSDPFVKRVTTGLPWVIAKWAQTIDGRIATRTGESQWISNEMSRRRVHRLRARVDAILTAMGTVLADNPTLTARGVRRVRRVARRVVLDPELDLSPESNLVRTACDMPTTVVCAQELIGAAIAEGAMFRLKGAGVDVVGAPASGHRLDLRHVLGALVDRHDATNVLVEAGPGLLGSLFEADLVDEAIVYVAPMLLGDELARSVASGRVAETLASGRSFELMRTRQLGSDVELTYRRVQKTSEG